MITVLYTPSFIKRYKALSPTLRAEVKEKIELFRKPAHHAHLKVRKLAAVENTCAFSVNFKIRIIFQYGKNKKEAHLLLVGSHDEVY